MGIYPFKLLPQRDAHDLLIIPCKAAFVGEGGVAPDDISIEAFVGGFEDLGSAQFFVTTRGELGDDEVAGFTEEEELVAILDQEAGA